MREIEVLAPALAAPADRHPPAELMEQLQQLKPLAVVPGSCQFVQESWSWQRFVYFPISYAQFSADVKEKLPATEVVRMNPGESFLLSEEGLEKSGRLKWIRPVGEQNVDYFYDPATRPASTAEIAGHFPEITPDAVLEFCRLALPERWQEVGTCEEPYFQKPLVWELRLYKKNGEFKTLFYKLDGNRISLLESAAAPDWRTELPFFKLQEAVFNGESLSSLYLRINEGLDPGLFRDVDIMQDPLLRVLYAGKFAAYQKAQLKKILFPGK
jgi:hypothetical protein